MNQEPAHPESASRSTESPGTSDTHASETRATPGTAQSTTQGEPRPAGAGTHPIVYPTLAIVGFLFLTWAIRRRGASKTPEIDLGPAQHASRLCALRSDLNELGERLATELDRKAEEVQTLLRQVDDRVETLRRERALLDQAGRRADVPSAPERGTGFIEAIALDPLHEKVANLAEQGLTPVQIAQRLGQPIGQVELILALRRRLVRS